MKYSLGALVRNEWSPLLVQGFAITDEDTGRVVLESATVQVVATHDLRGEVEVSVTPHGGEWPRQWSFSGMVGTASVARLLGIALVKMREEPGVLDGDPQFYEHLAADNEATSHEWTEYYAGRGPRPSRKHLP